MDQQFVAGFLFEAVKVAILLASPMLMAGLIAGVLVSIFQATTQINEMTLVFIPKMLAVALAFLIFFPWMLQVFIGFSQELFMNLHFYAK